MSKMKTSFDLDDVRLRKVIGCIDINISPDEKPYVSVHLDNYNQNYYMKESDLELFAVNILKALESNKLT